MIARIVIVILMLVGSVAFSVFAPSTCADILLPGHKNVKHELVFEDSDSLEGNRLIAAPIAGFSGVEEIKPGQSFRFSSKYGTTFYLVPEEVADIPKFDRERFEQWPHTQPPKSEIKSVPVTSPVASALTTLRFAGVKEGRPVVELVDHVELNRWGNEASATRSVMVFGLLIAAGLAFCLFAIRRMKVRNRRAIHDTTAEPN